MSKAKSRLNSHSTESESANEGSGLLQKYKKHLPTLLISLPAWLGLGYILLFVPPVAIKNLPLTNSFLFPVITYAFASFFSLAFVLLNSKLSLVISLLTSCLLFLKLQQVSFTTELISSLLIFFVILYLALWLISPRSSKK